MGVERRAPRRPASLDPAMADAIIGDTDPADGAVLAHTSAWALLGVGDELFGPEAVGRLREMVNEEGTDVVAEMWSRSPEFTLPGAMWRLYLLLQWYERDNSLVESRFKVGAASGQIPGVDDPGEIPDLGTVIRGIKELFCSEKNEDDLAALLREAAVAMRTIAASEGQAATWISDSADSLAHAVTIRPHALSATADELDEAAKRAEKGILD